MHIHILPGLDDGAKSLEEATEMLRIAYQEGIRDMIVTPHYYPGRFQADRSRFEEAYQAVAERAKELCPELTLYPGNEVYLGIADIQEAFYRKDIHTLAGSKYMLVEFHPEIAKEKLLRGLLEVTNLGCWPILAHAERYACMQGFRIDPEIYRLAYLQINAASLFGDFGSRAEKTARKLLKKGLVTFVATDAHSPRHRAPRLVEAHAFVAKQFGPDVAEALFGGNQRCVLNHERII